MLQPKPQPHASAYDRQAFRPSKPVLTGINTLKVGVHRLKREVRWWSVSAEVSRLSAHRRKPPQKCSESSEHFVTRICARNLTYVSASEIWLESRYHKYLQVQSSNVAFSGRSQLRAAWVRPVKCAPKPRSLSWNLSFRLSRVLALISWYSYD